MKTFTQIMALGLTVTGMMANMQEAMAATKLEFAQNKREAVASFDALIAKFEQANPDIDIEQNLLPEFNTVMQARMMKGSLPDVIAMGGDFLFGEMSRAGVLADFTGDPLFETLQPAYPKMLAKLAGTETANGIPFSANANTVLYNKKKFAELGAQVPTTWDEFIGLCEKIKAAGQTPLYLTFADAWTVMVPFNALAANLQGDDFIEKRTANETTFAERYRPVAEKMLQLLNYGLADNFSADYNQGNAAFAKGDAFMLIQGIWAISSIKQANPDVEIGVFTLPALNDAAQNRLVSGVDTVLTMSAATPNADAAKKFIAFLLQPENNQQYINEQKLYSAVKGVYQEDPQLVDIKSFFENGQITSFPDHYYPAGMQLANLVQEFLINKDIDAFLKKLDEEWDKVASRM